jgi:hypothetical protein
MKPEDVLVDEVWYRSQYPDVNGQIPGQFLSARDHFIRFGYQQGRIPIKPIFDEAWYLTTYPDVVEAVRSGRVKSGYDHFIQNGYAEGRKPSRYGGIALGNGGERQPLPRHSRKREKSSISKSKDQQNKERPPGG